MCASPQDVETLIKTCKQGAPYLPDACLFHFDTDMLMCEVMGPIMFEKADNYACTSQKDLKRIMGRCKQ